VFRRADEPDDVHTITLPPAGAYPAYFDLSSTPDWHGRIIEAGFAEFPTAQLVPADIAFRPFSLVEAELWSPSWRGSLGALGTDWSAYRPWALMSVSALGPDAPWPHKPTPVLVLTIGLAASLAIAAVLLARGWTWLGLTLCTAIAGGWLALDLRWIGEFADRHVLTRELYAGKPWRERAMIEPDTALIAASARVRDLLARVPPSTHVVGLIGAAEHERELERAREILPAVAQHRKRPRIERRRKRHRLQRHVLGADRIDAEPFAVLDRGAEHDMEIAARKTHPLGRLERSVERCLRGPAEQAHPQNAEQHDEGADAQPSQRGVAFRIARTRGGDTARHIGVVAQTSVEHDGRAQEPLDHSGIPRQPGTQEPPRACFTPPEDDAEVLFPFLINAFRAANRTPRDRIDDRPAAPMMARTDAGFHHARAKQCGTRRMAAARAELAAQIAADQLAWRRCDFASSDRANSSSLRYVGATPVTYSPEKQDVSNWVSSSLPSCTAQMRSSRS
jgi:hypothetical protein